jgi:hypothetical protein
MAALSSNEKKWPPHEVQIKNKRLTAESAEDAEKN